jgi:inward rectifier potassium channel
MEWRKFIAVLLAGYLSVNLLFAGLYFIAGPGALAGLEPREESPRLGLLLECFFFSVQTFATIGYGRVAPVSLFANALVTAEAFLGMLGIAISTGLLFSRFSKPTARIRFSSKAIIAPHDGVPTFLFRMVNERLNQVVEAQVRVGLVQNERTLEGEYYRNFHELELDRATSSAFVLSWTVVHAINEKSPLHGVTPEMLREREAEFIVSVTGIDDTFSQTIHARWSYTPDEIEWGGRFADMLERRPEEGKVHVSIDQLDRILPQES